MDGTRARTETLYLNVVESVRSSSPEYSKIYYAYFGIAFKANLASHFGISASVVHDRHDRKAYMWRPYAWCTGSKAKTTRMSAEGCVKLKIN